MGMATCRGRSGSTGRELDGVTTVETATQPDWDVLIDAVRNGHARRSSAREHRSRISPAAPNSRRKPATAEGYPFDDRWNLPRVTQYIATTKSPALVKQRVIDILAERQRTATSPEVHRLLAGLHQPLYITTNYDELLERALGAAGSTPSSTTCRWNDRLERRLGPYKKLHPTATTPDVFHLHGDLTDLHSLLLTEDDYIDFTVSRGVPQREQSQPRRSDPPPDPRGARRHGVAVRRVQPERLELPGVDAIHRQDAGPDDPELSESVSIQLEPDDLSGVERERAKRFLARYLSDSSAVTVHWCDATEFLTGFTSRLGGAGP